MSLAVKGYQWWQKDTSGGKWIPVAESGYQWLQIDIGGDK
jgi:hypothetical protein